MATQPKSLYTTQEKREAIELAEEIGPGKAARQLGLPRGTVSVWRYNDRQAKLAGRRRPPVSDPDDHDEQEPGEAESAPAEDAPTPPAAAPTRGRVARVYTPSQKAEALELAAKDGPTAAHKQLGISRYSIYAWQRKAALAAQVDQIAAKHKEWNGKLEV